ncbi:hypothetical protein T4C_14056 [Trichinella pseudospiralis]|uniref:Uncharacterized protein n=1 Tax=Trichinella pseudospiralis TaxID=6337 RepID=A0A0V1K3X6_TRIPS|nr:hypothetical protein T4C_14056 [Trichinella pseudospiralis]
MQNIEIYRYTGKQGRTAKREERREQLHDGGRSS